MPSNQTEHYSVTYDQWSGNQGDSISLRYKKIIDILKSENIKNYIDLGANTGGVCDVILERIPTIEKCYLVEPQCQNIDFMKKNYEFNEKVEILPYGIHYGSDVLPLFRLDANVGGYTAIQYDGSYNTGENMVCKQLEDLGFGDIDFIKIDVEGSEFNILENSSLIKTIKYIEIEVHEPYMGQMDKFKSDYIEKYLQNYEIVDQEGSHVFLKKII